MTIQELMEKRAKLWDEAKNFLDTKCSDDKSIAVLTPNAVMTAILFPKMTKRPILQWKIVLLPSTEKLTV